MSKRRAAILSVVVEGRTQAQTARQHKVSESTVSRWVARYRAEGDTAFESRSRRPRTAPAAIPDETVELVVNLRSELSALGLDAGPHTIAWHLQQRHQITVSPSTIRRRLAERGLVEPNPKKRPRSSYVRFQADLPNEMWQSDFCHWPLSDGSTTEIITWLDDHSRCALSVTAHRRITGPIVVETFDQTCADHGFPASTLTDNAMGLHHPALRRPRRTQRPRDPPRRPRHRPEELCARPPHHLRKSREIPTNPQKMAQSPNPRQRPLPPPSTHRPIHRQLQPQPPPPGPRPHNPSSRLQPAPQSNPPAQRRRHPPQSPTRPHRQIRNRHTAPQRQTPPHRHRPSPQTNPRHPAGHRPPHQSHRNPNRRTPPTPNPQPQHRLPTTPQNMTPRRFAPCTCLDTSHSAPGRIRTCGLMIRSHLLYPD